MQLLEKVELEKIASADRDATNLTINTIHVSSRMITAY